MERDAAMSPAAIRQMITKNANGTYTVAFGDGTRVTVTPEIPVNGARVSDEAGWPAILEKATAERAGGYDLPNGGAAADALRWLTGTEPTPHVAKFDMPDTGVISRTARPARPSSSPSGSSGRRTA